jgi:flavin reductase (DIM6/NTAB) family NADH-FMN oxidoreductase RutF
MSDKRFFEAASLDPVDRSKLMMGLIVPRPIGWVGSRSPEGTDNVAPFSFFTMVAATPPTVLFVPGMRVRTKDTLRNVRDTGWFTLSVVSSGLAAAMNTTSGDYSIDVDEFAVAGLTSVDGTLAPAPMVAEAKANMECRVSDIHEIGDEPAAAVVYGEVVAIHAADEILDGTRIDFERLDAVGRLAGSWYSGTTDRFEMERPGRGVDRG